MVSKRQLLVSAVLCGLTSVQASAEGGDPIPLAVDVGFVFDRSGSFGDDIATFRSVADSMTRAIADQVDDLAVGLGTFVDAPCSGFGAGADFGYKQDMALTTDLAALGSTLSVLDVLDGHDAPESQLEAAYQALTGAGRVVNRGGADCLGKADIATSDLGWRLRTQKFLFISTDAAFHRPTDANYPYPSTSDDVIRAANAIGARVYFLYAGGYPDADAQKIADATDGEVRVLGSDSAGIDLIVEQLVMEKIREIEARR